LFCAHQALGTIITLHKSLGIGLAQGHGTPTTYPFQFVVEWFDQVVQPASR
jgi:hypothetical protein